tara:strand:- start:318 stop:659 length:342 start_codon:yes stop_codon:yes gene_type:complete
MSTIFSKIINKEIHADILFENDKILAFRDTSPQAPVHFLVIPKKEIRTINDINEEDKSLIGELFIVAKDIAKKEGISEKGYRTIFNCNEYGGQTVYHIHLHVLGGRRLEWPPG